MMVNHGTSEDFIVEILDKVPSGEHVCMWLDGHYSGFGTFKGQIETPIQFELDSALVARDRFSSLVLFIDDFRLFRNYGEDQGEYPMRKWLVNWAEANSFAWTIEHDIFVAFWLRSGPRVE